MARDHALDDQADHRLVGDARALPVCSRRRATARVPAPTGPPRRRSATSASPLCAREGLAAQARKVRLRRSTGTPRSPAWSSDMPWRGPREHSASHPVIISGPQLGRKARVRHSPLQQVRESREVDGEPARLVQREGPGLPCNARIDPAIEHAEALPVGGPRFRPAARPRATAAGSGAASRLTK